LENSVTGAGGDEAFLTIAGFSGKKNFSRQIAFSRVLR
jgi:hypothetical protein